MYSLSKVICKPQELLSFNPCFVSVQMATPSASRWDETPGRPKGSETPGVTPHRPGSETPGATPSTRIWESTPGHATPGNVTPGHVTPGHATPSGGNVLSISTKHTVL